MLLKILNDPAHQFRVFLGSPDDQLDSLGLYALRLRFFRLAAPRERRGAQQTQKQPAHSFFHDIFHLDAPVFL